MAMRWSELSERDRVRPILEKVMSCFILEQTATGYDTPSFPRGINAPAGFHWPIAFWNTDGECWMVKDIATDPKVFDPLHDMNDAWQVVESHKFMEVKLEYAEGWRSEKERWQSYICTVSPYQGTLATGYSKTPAKAICKAALRAVGVEIE